jgi:hypothetical protein
VTGPAWSDAASWNATRYFSTIRLLDFDGDGKQDVCARAAKGIVCHRSTGEAFGPELAGPAWSDAAGFTAAKYYGTLRTGDVDGDGKDDLCIRDNAGMLCTLSTGEGFGEPFRGPEWSDTYSWGNPLYYSSIRLADIDGDGKADLCARTAANLVCHFSTGTGFGPAVEVAPLSDASGWSDPSNAETLRTGDIDGDGAVDLCIRADASLSCWTYRDGAFVAIDGPDWSDASGWSADPYYQTIRLGDATGDGRADLCGRAAKGWICAPSEANGFGEAIASTVFSDADGWDQPTYFSTLFFASPLCQPSPEVCNQKDDDCDGQIDEGEVCSLGASGTNGTGGVGGTSGAGAGAGATGGSRPAAGGGTGSAGHAGSEANNRGAPGRAVAVDGDDPSTDGSCSVGAPGGSTQSRLGSSVLVALAAAAGLVGTRRRRRPAGR